MKKIVITLLLLLVTAFASGCTVQTQDEPDAQPAAAEAEVTCEVTAKGEKDMVLQFSDPDVVAPGGTVCVSLGGGAFDCPPTFCLAGYAGTCPRCPQHLPGQVDE